jgi:co-chaperonin GroES (HSP10)
MLVLKKVKPLLDGVITTANRYDEVFTSGGLIDPNKSGTMKEYQTVMFASESTQNRGIKVGDLVMVNFYNYAKPVQKKGLSNELEENYHATLSFSFPMIEINGKECLNLRAGDIMFIIEEMEEIKEKGDGNITQKKKKSNLEIV